MTCKKCSLIMGNKGNGFRYGNPDAEFVILRDFPTRQECANGDGNTKQNIWLINKLKAIGFDTNMYHIVNLINCFPHHPAHPDEVKLCSSNLNSVITTKPKIVMTLGLESYNYMTTCFKTSELYYTLKINSNPITICK